MADFIDTTRRGAFKALTLLGAVVVPAVAQARSEMSASDRMAFHFEEFQRAATELMPGLHGWVISGLSPADKRSRMVSISAYRMRGCFAGDGWYQINNGGHGRDLVRHIKDTGSPDWLSISESEDHSKSSRMERVDISSTIIGKVSGPGDHIIEVRR